MPAMLAIMRAIRGSDLPPTDRHILMTLASLADPETGVIPERFQPSFSDLAHFTGLGRSTVGRRLPLIEEAGWIKRIAPSLAAAWKDKEKNSYLLLIPNQDGSSEPGGGGSAGPSTGPRAGLVPQRDQSGGQSQSGTSPTAGPVLVPERDRTSPTAGLEVTGPSGQANQTPPSEGFTHTEQQDPGALFAMAGVGGRQVAATATKTAPAKTAAKRKRLSRVITKNPETLNADWHVSEEMAAWAKENAPGVIARLATARFLTHFGDSGKRHKDWDRAWRNWLLKDQQDLEQRNKPPSAQGAAQTNYQGRRNGSTYIRMTNSHAPDRNYDEDF